MFSIHRMLLLALGGGGEEEFTPLPPCTPYHYLENQGLCEREALVGSSQLLKALVWKP